MSEANKKGHELVARWERTERAVVKAEEQKAEAMQDLAEWLLPKDAEEGECFAIWIRLNNKQERLLVALIHHLDPLDVSFSWRHREKPP